MLDGVQRESQVGPFLPEVGDSAVIVTARLRLTGLGDAYRLPVPSLSIGEAVQFLERIIGPARVGSDPRAAEQIVRTVGLLPLGVRVIGDKLAGLRHLPLREYLARIAHPPTLLDELSAVDPALRQRLDEAAADLPDAARRVFLRLAALPDPVFTLAEAASVLDADQGDAVRMLEVLLEASVIAAPATETVARTVVYEMPPLMYARAREKADGPEPHPTVVPGDLPEPNHDHTGSIPRDFTLMLPR